MVKKLVLFSVIFSINILAGETRLEFSDSKLNEVKFEKESNKPALQQFLEQGFRYADIITPYRSIALIRTGVITIPSEYPQDKPSFIDVLCPHWAEVPSEYEKYVINLHKELRKSHLPEYARYAIDLHKALLKSDLLVAAVYREVILRDKGQQYSIINAGDSYGFWKCGKYNNCTRFTYKETQAVLENQ